MPRSVSIVGATSPAQLTRLLGQRLRECEWHSLDEIADVAAANYNRTSSDAEGQVWACLSALAIAVKEDDQ